MQLERIRFEGDELDVVRDERGVWVSTRRVCDALGLAVPRQREKLKSKPWAVDTLMVSTGPDGKRYEMHCLHLDSLPMWLATIDERRVAEHVRPKLAKYQLECARVLRDHFFGAGAPSADVKVLVDSVAQMAAAMGGIVGALEGLARRVTDLEARGAMGGVITAADRQRLRWDVKALATLETEAGFRPSVASATTSIYNELRAATGWSGPGQTFDRLPAHLYAHQVTKALAKRRADVERVLVGKAKRRQLSLLPESHSEPSVDIGKLIKAHGAIVPKKPN